MFSHWPITYYKKSNNGLAGNTNQTLSVTPQMILSYYNVEPAIYLLLLKLISKWVVGLFNLKKWFLIDHEYTESEYNNDLAANTK